MPRKKIVAGNWKMNLNWVEGYDLVATIRDTSGIPEDVTCILFPPFPYLQMCSVLLQDKKNFFAGAQNCSHHAKGAYTGEVSATMIRSAGCQFVMIGHSERRIYFSEKTAELKGKMEQAIQNRLQVVYCVGENLQERNEKRHFSVVQEQLSDVLSVFPAEYAANLVVAYEPVWAIGTGETATAAQAQEMHAFIRESIAGIFNREISASMSILYGGSCNASNAKELFACADVDGGLIGGASLKASEFSVILRSFG